jgi:hypothetical protein
MGCHLILEMGMCRFVCDYHHHMMMNMMTMPVFNNGII